MLLELDTLTPYGEGFDFPIFCLKGIHLSSPRPFGNRLQKNRTPHIEFKVTKGKDVSGSLKQKQRFLRATGFGLWEKYQQLTKFYLKMKLLV